MRFARYYADAGWNVIATARKPEAAAELNALAADNPQVVVEQLDVTDLERIQELAAAYEGTTIDLLINNAALLGGRAEQMFGSQNWNSL